MARVKICVEESYLYEYVAEIGEDEDVEEFIKRIHPAFSISAQVDRKPTFVQYSADDSEWVEIHDTEGLQC